MAKKTVKQQLVDIEKELEKLLKQIKLLNKIYLSKSILNRLVEQNLALLISLSIIKIYFFRPY